MMTDDEILLLAEQSVNKMCVIAVTNDDLVAFARAIEQRTLTNQKARWYQEGVEAEREACANYVESNVDDDLNYDETNESLKNIAAGIRARGA
jgi:dephospho-CoA kinase